MDVRIQWVMTSTYVTNLDTTNFPKAPQHDPNAFAEWMERHGHELLEYADCWTDTDPGSVEVDEIEEL